MTAHLVVRRPEELHSTSSPFTDPSPSQASYWEEANHSCDSFLRIENWKTPEIAAYCLPVTCDTISLTSGMIHALLRYREELKMYAALNDANITVPSRSTKTEGSSCCCRSSSSDAMTPLSPPPPPTFSPSDQVLSMEQPDFLDYHSNRILSEWQIGRRSEWLTHLLELEERINQKISTVFSNKPIFIKLSVRSPKDSVFCLQSTFQKIRQHILFPSSSSRTCDPLQLDDPLFLHENILLLKLISFENLAVTNGQDALNLLTRSDRIYLDLLQSELFSQKLLTPLETCYIYISHGIF
jgi:hypothetical protein